VAVVLVALAVGGYAWWKQRQDAKASALLAEALAVSEAPVAPTPTPSPDGSPAPATPPAPGSYPTEQARLQAALPKFLAAAEAYPSATPGIAARYHAAATLVALGKDDEALRRYQEVIDRAGTSLYGRVARLGVAEVQVRQGKYDPAINTLKELSTSAKDDLPVDGILMQLGRAYALAGRTAEAAQSFKRITDEFTTSPYAADAKRELDGLKHTAS
jgi:predicted negative regulator of RcsB-dependent stress response